MNLSLNEIKVFLCCYVNVYGERRGANEEKLIKETALSKDEIQSVCSKYKDCFEYVSLNSIILQLTSLGISIIKSIFKDNLKKLLPDWWHCLELYENKMHKLKLNILTELNKSSLFMDHFMPNEPVDDNLLWLAVHELENDNFIKQEFGNRYGITTYGIEYLEQEMKWRKMIFIAMPIRSKKEVEEGRCSEEDVSKNQDLFITIKKAANSSGYETKRSDELIKFGSPILIDHTIIEWLDNAALVIVDLTENNANVYFEAGYRHGSGKPYLRIAKHSWKKTFDIDHYPILFYENEEDLTKKLEDYLKMNHSV